MTNIIKYIIVFDGECNFCSYWVNFVIERDKKDKFRFASLQSEKGKEVLSQFNVKSDLSTVVLIKNDVVKAKSSAALHIAYELGGIYSLSIVFTLVPKFIRDWMYDVVAANRKRLLKSKSCIIPEQSMRYKFIG